MSRLKYAKSILGGNIISWDQIKEYLNSDAQYKILLDANIYHRANNIIDETEADSYFVCADELSNDAELFIIELYEFIKNCDNSITTLICEINIDDDGTPKEFFPHFSIVNQSIDSLTSQYKILDKFILGNEFDTAVYALEVLSK